MPGDAFVFGPFRLETRTRQLIRGEDPVHIAPRHFDLLHVLVAHAGEVISKDRLIAAAWQDVAVTDNSLEQAISSLRRMLGAGADDSYIETQARRGYRFVAPVTHAATRDSDESLDALLAPHRAWTEGRAALERLEGAGIAHARDVFERALALVPNQPQVHVGLANTQVMTFEMTRSDLEPDVAALQSAEAHAREACRLDIEYGEAWATLAFVLVRTGRLDDALAAARRSIALEPDNWRHHLRLASIAWGEERLRAARRTLALMPGCSLACWLAATVYVARQAFGLAQRELETAIALQDDQPSGPMRFRAVALHWLLGLIVLRDGDEPRALAEFGRELATEWGDHLYARECRANTWYATGAVHLVRGRLEEARDAFGRAEHEVPGHPMAHAAVAEVDRLENSRPPETPTDEALPRPTRLPYVMSRAARLVLAGRTADAAELVDRILAEQPPGDALWTLPVEPLLRVHTAPQAWIKVLARIQTRAA